MSSRDAVHALRRFGLGSRPGEIGRIASDSRGFVLGQLDAADAARLSGPDLESSHAVLAEVQRARRAQRQAREQMKEVAGLSPEPAAKAMEGAAPKPSSPDGAAASASSPVKPGAIRREAFVDELSARIDRAVFTDTPLLERLVMFWSNHFCVSAAKGPVRGIAGSYEREVIRPHVLGRFADMLRASAQHPAMLIYLDNQVSIGPNSQAGRNRGRGLNENLAREILELHTVGVDGGYGQDDVTNFARILTGWTIGTIDAPLTEPGKFFYAANRHEPGAWTVLGKRYQDKGRLSGEDVLADLARHPSTARHIARKLARHFLGDTSPPLLVERLETEFRSTDGDLGAVTRALATSPEVWSAPPAKVVPPYDFLISIVRGFGYRPKAGELARLAAALGQPIWTPPAPKGWPDDDDAWMGPSAVRERLRIAEMAARTIDKLSDPRKLASDLLGEALSDDTRQAIARAESREQGFELLIMSPEFLRR